MSLVAYADSDEELSYEEDEDSETNSSVIINKTVTNVSEKIVQNGKELAKSEEANELFAVKGDKIEDIDDDSSSASNLKNSSLFPSLPAPKSKTPSIDVSWVDKPKSKSQPVKILIPSLAEFVEEEPEEPVKKKIKPAVKGSGLFALLPKPKSEESSLKLIPPSVKKKPAPLVPKQVKATINAAPSAPKPSAKLDLGYNDSDEEEVETGKSIDFFSLAEKPEEVTLPISAADVPSIPDVPPHRNSHLATSSVNQAASFQGQAEDYSSAYYSDQSAAGSTNDFLQFQGGSSHQVQPATSADYIPFDSSELALDDDALRQLCGRKDRKAVAGQLVDVHGDNLVMNSREWLMQSLSEEKVTKSHKKNKKDGPSTVEKRKHQITYLAYQAKENELELKNTWANNRQTKKQTQAKYGF